MNRERLSPAQRLARTPSVPITHESLDAALRGCTHVNLREFGERYFTVDFLLEVAGSYRHALQMTEGLAGLMNVSVGMAELDKAIGHFCARKLLDDMWQFNAPVAQAKLDSEGRFKLDEIFDGEHRPKLGENIHENLELGGRYVVDLFDAMYGEWFDTLNERRGVSLDEDPTRIYYFVYDLFSKLMRINYSDKTPAIESTFMDSAHPMFRWMEDEVGLTREQLDRIIENTVQNDVRLAGNHGLHSQSRSEVLQRHLDRGERIYVLDPENECIVHAPGIDDEIPQEMEVQRKHFPDQTDLLLGCAAKHVTSDLYPTGSMLHDILRYKFNLYRDIYLATKKSKNGEVNR